MFDTYKQELNIGDIVSFCDTHDNIRIGFIYKMTNYKVKIIKFKNIEEWSNYNPLNQSVIDENKFTCYIKSPNKIIKI